jgi:radical SAM protein with 4Fe4S-binding SPASM domain
MDGLVSVSPSGDLLPCSSYFRPMGNLLRDDFRMIWFSGGSRYFKRKEYAPGECAGCESFRACQAACPLYWRYAGTGEIRGRALRARGQATGRAGVESAAAQTEAAAGGAEPLAAAR